MPPVAPVTTATLPSSVSSIRMRSLVLRPIAAGNRDRTRPTVADMPLALITGASRGLGLALARALARDGWSLVIDARGATDLEHAARELGAVTEVAAIAG